MLFLLQDSSVFIRSQWRPKRKSPPAQGIHLRRGLAVFHCFGIMPDHTQAAGNRPLLVDRFDDRIREGVQFARFVGVQCGGHGQALVAHGHVLELFVDKILHQVA